MMQMEWLSGTVSFLAQSSMAIPTWAWWMTGVGATILLAMAGIGMRYIPNNRAGVVEKLWSSTGSVGEGGILALNGEAGFQAQLLRGGLHFGY